MNITEFAPRSVKSDGDFEDILGEKTPAVWRSNRPAKGGDAGALFARIIEQAEKLKRKPQSTQKSQKKTTKARRHEKS